MSGPGVGGTMEWVLAPGTRHGNHIEGVVLADAQTQGTSQGNEEEEKTVSKNTGMESRNPLREGPNLPAFPRTRPARHEPRDRLPHAPSVQVPMMAAKATTKPMPPAVSPNP